ncbi:winged helix-turn-helix domain-containing protein [Aureimonas populi]|uniref:Winged helix-turn-helix domain-containing protein n=1 Tax=Aureimonas populi TaxID=1701758 RepID=A0ABW5CLD3_9HYPH|nr:LysR family transcriptional regulator [Aureimonas populi]
MTAHDTESTPRAQNGLGGVPRLRLVFGPQAIIGPGRAELLERVARTGSLAAAGREMRMSYKRAWSLVEELNRTFDTPLVELSRGGAAHGGAVLTPLGAEIVERYRRMQALSEAAIAPDLKALAARLAPRADGA